MKFSYLTALISVAATLFATGCGSESHSEANGENRATPSKLADRHEEGVEFRKGKGLKVSEGTAKYIGLRIEDVTERDVTASQNFTAQVYRTATEAQFASTTSTPSRTAYASAKVQPEVAHDLENGKGTLLLTSPSGKELQGKVKEVLTPFGKGPESQREVLIAVRDDSNELKHGSVLTAELRGTLQSSVATVPETALLKTAEGTFVYTVSGEFLLRTPVKIGANAEGSAVEIKDGLYTGDEIVVHPIMTLWMAELQAIRGGASCADGH